MFTPLPEHERYYIVNYRPPKSTSITMFKERIFAYQSFRKVPDGTPRTFIDIQKLPDADFWLEATQIELDNMFNNDCWESVDIDEQDIPAHLILPSQLLYEKQFNPDQSFKKYKCRLVIRGDKWYDVYNMNTYASTVKSETVRMALSIAAIEDFEMESVDVRAAFLHAPLKPGEVIYMKRPPGLNDFHMLNLKNVYMA